MCGSPTFRPGISLLERNQENVDSRKTILIVDDSRSVQVHVKQRLEEAGFDVLLADDGVAAVRIIAEDCPDAAILDINMPELDGYGVCQELEKMRPDLPVVFLTSVRANAVELLGRRWGAYLAKPVCGEKLVQTLNQVLRGRGNRESRTKELLPS